MNRRQHGGGWLPHTLQLQLPSSPDIELPHVDFAKAHLDCAHGNSAPWRRDSMHEPPPPLRLPLVPGTRPRLVLIPALAGWCQFHPLNRQQPTRVLAGGHLRPGDHRARTGLGRQLGDDQHAHLPPRLVLGAGRRRLPRAHRPGPDDRCAPGHRCPLRVL